MLFSAKSLVPELVMLHMWVTVSRSGGTPFQLGLGLGLVLGLDSPNSEPPERRNQVAHVTDEQHTVCTDSLIRYLHDLDELEEMSFTLTDIFLLQDTSTTPASPARHCVITAQHSAVSQLWS